MKKIIGFLAIAITTAGALFAQHIQHDAGGAAPVTLLPGLGAWKHPIATRSPEALKFFDQGLVLLYGFNRPEALRSFRKVLELDPHAAMANWGISMALGPYLNMDGDPAVDLKGSCSAAQAGLKIQGLSTQDRDWLTAAATRCPDYSAPAKYVQAMQALAAKYPDDPDAQTLLAEALLLPVRWRWYGPDGRPAPGVSEAEHILEAVIRRYPEHPGANHLYIHAVESSPTPERGIGSAQRLMGIVPAAGHIVHMPGHIWLAIGDYRTTIDVNERAVRVDREYFARLGAHDTAMSAYYMYYLHNLQFIVYARAMQGRAADTKKDLAQMTEAAKPMPDFADFVAFTDLTARVRIQDWDGILAVPEPATAPARVFRHYARAMAFSARGSRPQAFNEQKQFETAAAKLDRNMVWSTNNLGAVLDLAAAVLKARLEPSQTTALPLWRKAVSVQDSFVYDEPPGWYYPVRESLGAALLRAGSSGEAESIFREGLRRSPRNGRMLFGLLEALKAQHKMDSAAWVQKEYDRAWTGADIPLRIGDL